MIESEKRESESQGFQMKYSKEQEEALELLTNQAITVYQTALSKTGNLEMSKDILFQFLKVVLFGNNNSNKFMI